MTLSRSYLEAGQMRELYVGAVDDARGAVVGIDRFGESAPGPELFKHFGFTVESVGAAVRRVLS